MKPSHRADRTGRSKGIGQFVALPAYMLNCPAWQALSLTGRCALIELLRVYKGGNNGELVMGVRTLGERLSCSKDTAARALNELEEKGFIGVQKMGVYGRPMATEYYLTMHRNDVDLTLPSKAFMRWNGPPVPVSKTSEAVSPVRRSQQNYKEQSHQRDCNGPKRPPLSLMGETHIHLTMAGRSCDGSSPTGQHEGEITTVTPKDA